MPKSIVASTASAFSENTVKLYIHLPPCFAAKPIEGIQEQLNGFLMRYVPQVDGVVLAHSDLELLQSSGRVMYDSPYSHFWISVKLLVWKPIKGSVLYGTINLQSPDHIGLLLYGTFNASIPSRLIPKDKYEFSNDLSKPRAKKAKANDTIKEDDSQEEDESSMDSFLNGEWVVKGTGESIGDEGVIGFEVAELVRTNDMLTVTGSLMGVPVTMRRPSMMIQPSCLENVPSSGQKKRSAPADDEDDSEANKDQALTESDRKRIKKEKKKAERSAESSSVPEAQETAVAPVSEAKKEKKDKKDKKEKKAKKAKTEA
ncbi:hypothetical protein BGW38_009154 [Lunasporangiospora selenospora]|uniref:RPA43 OB domain-containing protein n=1 Tax=Lunasporangiospora selenospora TaxID=979761 RepID=A0A9P6G309_9FUNG|nr:hypothetical protein BGW38_009154 [Lunasporangiospora selenospora]